MPTPLYEWRPPGERLGSIVWICQQGAADGKQNASLTDGLHGSVLMPYNWAMHVATVYKHEQPSRYVAVMDEDGDRQEISDPRRTTV